MTSPKVWFITGSSTGLGRHATECALNKGDNVVATLRNPSMLEDLTAQYPSSRLVTFPLDVTDASAITTAFNQATSYFGRVDVVFNNAGYFVVSEAEGMPHKAAREMFDVLLWGAENVMREAIRCFRDINRPAGGFILNVSSRNVSIPQFGCVHYASAKAALDSLTEGYIGELDPEWHIKMTLLEPALIRTPVTQNCMTVPIHPAYVSNPSLPSRQYRALYPDIGKTHFDGDPAKFAEVVYKVSRLDDPPLRLPLHRHSLESSRKKGESLLEGAEKWASWSDDLYIRK